MAKRGPNTDAGRRRSALNAVTHGVMARAPVIPGVESPAEWTRHLAGFQASLAPQTAFEAYLVERIALTAWRLKRIELYENEMLSIAQVNAEERAAARILFPAGGAISLRGGPASSLIRARIANLRRLTVLLTRFQTQTPGWAQVTPEDVELLYDGLNLILARTTTVPEALQRQVLADITTEATEDNKARTLAENVRRLMRELDELVDAPSPVNDTPAVPPDVPRIIERYPVDLALIRLWPEIRRLEHELADLDATVARTQSESLILDAGELAKVTRYEAHLRRQLIQYLHELQAIQK